MGVPHHLSPRTRNLPPPSKNSRPGNHTSEQFMDIIFGYVAGTFVYLAHDPDITYPPFPFG